MSSIAMHGQHLCTFKLVFDDRCMVVHYLAQVVRLWDRHRTFDLVGRNRTGPTQALMPGCIEEFGESLHARQTDLKDPALKDGLSVERDEKAMELLADLDKCPWSLLLIDERNERWSGPEAIPIILKSLPFGKLAAVAYILPGTMWLTRQLYLIVSRLSRNARRPRR